MKAGGIERILAALSRNLVSFWGYGESGIQGESFRVADRILFILGERLLCDAGAPQSLHLAGLSLQAQDTFSCDSRPVSPLCSHRLNHGTLLGSPY
jgi:hypothetical protein